MENNAKLSEVLGELLNANGEVLATAESCTGGGIATAVTDVAGSSAWFDRAFITYSNEAKIEMLSVQEDTLVEYGAVSLSVVKEMVKGALNQSNATIAVAVSGIAGPGGGTAEKPVGTVCFAWEDSQGWRHSETLCFSGDRGEVRKKVVKHAMKVLCEHLSS